MVAICLPWKGTKENCCLVTSQFFLQPPRPWCPWKQSWLRQKIGEEDDVSKLGHQHGHGRLWRLGISIATQLLMTSSVSECTRDRGAHRGKNMSSPKYIVMRDTFLSLRTTGTWNHTCSWPSLMLLIQLALKAKHCQWIREPHFTYHCSWNVIYLTP